MTDTESLVKQQQTVWLTEPQMHHCTHCDTDIETQVTKSLTDVGLIVCCCLGVFTLCCWVVTCYIESFNCYTHTCTKCNHKIGCNNAGTSINY